MTRRHATIRLPLAMAVAAVTTLATAAVAQPKGGPRQVEAPRQRPAGGRAARPDAPDVTQTEEQGEEGMKTYQFEAVEVEGRMRSPKVLYFLRRVRAEFAADTLGHRSFMLELSDTKRRPAFR